ncbi:pimeloyl-ACP methyl ester carboxylesterase [Actimicrobium sp. GrIS 1.19]|uniref:alpha/beta fold hydrolase n=1 Tax=Actimicrobium sp. GrIS 1.19 TaxID=3071708 RepID=UPI002E02D29F|nr:pimeloyl-ACP methyl ester carboxylesterase [Actimicrobium sp. GrIS 1.19]
MHSRNLRPLRASASRQAEGGEDVNIPGFVSNVEMVWEQPQLAHFLARAAREFRVIIFDRRGVGLSDRTLERPSMATAVSDVLAVLDAAGSKRAVVFGASEGGPVAIQLCCAHPRRVAGLCLYAALPSAPRCSHTSTTCG